MKLAPAWLAVPTGAVPVYSVASPTLSALTPAAVPRGCQCVFISPTALNAWLKAHSTGTARFELDASRVLAFMLLHEAGHLKQGNPAADFTNGAVSQLNVDPTRAKANEEEADEFAADLIRKAMTSRNSNSLTASLISMELTHLSWNMQAYRTLDEFGATALGKPAVFFDHGYSHPNLAWRILRSNHLIHQSATTRKLLESFEEARERGMAAKPLFQRDPRPGAD